MAKRKSLTKKTRFEVFKRDNFTCQYCGSKAPDVILEVDHIEPVAKGGTNDLINLVTSCFACNRGKSDRKISDNSVVEKQRLQIEELNLRRQQLEMMLQHRDGLKSIESESSQKAIDYFDSLWNHNSLNEYGQNKLTDLVKKYGVMKVLDTIDKCNSKYRYAGNDEEENFRAVFGKLGGFLNIEGKPDHIKKIAYIKGICRNKFHDFNSSIASIILNQYHKDGYDLEHLQDLLKSDSFSSWYQFKRHCQG